MQDVLIENSKVFFYLTDSEPRIGLLMQIEDGLIYLFILATLVLLIFGTRWDRIASKLLVLLLACFFVSGNQVQITQGLFIDLSLLYMPMPLIEIRLIQTLVYILGIYISFRAFIAINKT